MDVPERDSNRSDQPSVEDTSRAQKGEEVGYREVKLIEVRDEQQQFRADKSGDDDVNAEIEDAVGIESPSLSSYSRELQAEQIRGGEQDAVSWNRDRPDAKQLWIHDGSLPPVNRESSMRRRR